MKINLVVLYGGKSVEHDISIITAISVLKNLDTKQYKVLPIYISKGGVMYQIKNALSFDTYKKFNPTKNKVVSFVTGRPYLARKFWKSYKPFYRVDAVLNCCHGTYGEDGNLQGVIEFSNIPQTTCNVLASSICMDKVVTKQICMANSLPTPNFIWVKEKEYKKDDKFFKQIINQMDFPLVIKPANLGSSIGINKVENETQLREAIEIAFHFDNKIIIEQVIDNLIEINNSAMIQKGKLIISDLEVSAPWQTFYSFEDKYLKDKIRPKIIPFNQDLQNQIKQYTAKIYEVFNCDGVIRVDYLVDSKTNTVYIGEINTIPGGLAHHLYPQTFSKFLDILVANAITTHMEKLKINRDYMSPVLDNYSSNKLESKVLK